MGVESPGFANQSGSYSAEVARRAWFGWLARTGANTPGIVTGGLVAAADCQLAAPGSGMSVNVSTGELYIGGTEGAVQGGYYARVSSTTNLVISAANPSNPRIDLVCATVSDSGYTEPTGGSGNQWALQVITGTPTSGATLTNLNGVGTLPASSLLLGYVLVPTSATNIITADIANVAAPAPLVAPRVSFVQPAAGSDYTTTSTTYVGVDSGLSIAIACSGSPVKMTFCGSARVASSSNTIVIGNALDGTVSGSGVAIIGPTVGIWSPFCAVTMFTPSAGVHTFAPYYAIAGSGSAEISRASNVIGPANQLPTLIVEQLGSTPA